MGQMLGTVLQLEEEVLPGGRGDLQNWAMKNVNHIGFCIMTLQVRIVQALVGVLLVKVTYRYRMEKRIPSGQRSDLVLG